PAAAAEGLKEFVSGGGTLVAIGTAVNWVNARKIVPVRFREEKKEQQPDRPRLEKRRPYAAARDDAALRSIPGSIFKARVDPSHPIGYGFDGDEPLPVFRNNRVILELSENAYSTPVAYDREPLLGGYVSEENLKRLAGSAGAVVVPSGS